MNARVRGGDDASNHANGDGSEAYAIDLGRGSPFIVLDASASRKTAADTASVRYSNCLAEFATADELAARRSSARAQVAVASGSQLPP